MKCNICHLRYPGDALWRKCHHLLNFEQSAMLQWMEYDKYFCEYQIHITFKLSCTILTMDVVVDNMYYLLCRCLFDNGRSCRCMYIYFVDGYIYYITCVHYFGLIVECQRCLPPWNKISLFTFWWCFMHNFIVPDLSTFPNIVWNQTS